MRPDFRCKKALECFEHRVRITMLEKHSQTRFHRGRHQSLNFNNYFTSFTILFVILCSSILAMCLS
jgi:hypothetical protein